jgi:uncharacterized protein YjiS (DUF1127 family)
MSNRLSFLAHIISDRVAARRRSHRAEAELAALDDRELADIGLTRGDIPFIVIGAEPFRLPAESTGCRSAA